MPQNKLKFKIMDFSVEFFNGLLYLEIGLAVAVVYIAVQTIRDHIKDKKFNDENF